MGIISLILIVPSLRLLKVGWLPTLIILFITATLKFLVIASGTADEIFCRPFICIGILGVFHPVRNFPKNKAFWSAAAGIFAGILMYEYTSYRVYIFVGDSLVAMAEVCLRERPRKKPQDHPGGLILSPLSFR